jgi:hypothetical protein
MSTLMEETEKRRAILEYKERGYKWRKEVYSSQKV